MKRQQEHLDQLLRASADADVQWSNPLLVGRGGMGSVYRVESALGERKAIKIMHPPEVAGALSAQYSRAFFDGAVTAHRKIESIRNKTNLVMTYSTLGGTDIKHLLMEYVPGPNLRDVIGYLYPRPCPQPRQYSSVDLAWAVAVLRQLAEAVGQLHLSGMSHLDVKPENVILSCPEWDAVAGVSLDSEEESVRAEQTRRRQEIIAGMVGTPVTDDSLVRLTDYGVSRVIESYPGDAASTQRVVGSWLYTAPELYLPGRKPSFAADVYSFGAVAYELLTGWVLVGLNPPRPRQLNPEVPEWLEAIICRCLDVDPQKRYTAVNAPRDQPGDLLLADLDRRQAPITQGSRRERWQEGHELPVSEEQRSAARTLGVPPAIRLLDAEGSTRCTMVLVPSGDYQIGSDASEFAGEPRHSLSIDPFFISVDYLQTQAAWEEADRTCRNLGGTLPSNAEWEAAMSLAAAGTLLPDLERSRREWCEDDFDDKFYRMCKDGEAPAGRVVCRVTDGRDRVPLKVVRGGSGKEVPLDRSNEPARADSKLAYRLVLPASAWSR